MPSLSPDSLFGRDPLCGIIAADINSVVVVSPERVKWFRAYSSKEPQDRSAINIPLESAFGTIVRNYRIGSVYAEPGRLKIDLIGDLHYATVSDFYEMIRIPPGTDMQQLLLAINRKMDERSC